MKNTVLVIEDNEQNLYLVRFLLEKHGFSVQEARDGRLGVTLASELQPDLILLDIQLPMLDGYAVAEEIRRDPALRDTPIIAVTSYAMVGDREKALASGATDYIEKPINPGTFIDQIAKHLPR
jgi:CheY-like chemotaxis protein